MRHDRPPPVSALLLLLLLLLGACSAAGFGESQAARVAEREQGGVPTSIEIVDAGHVRYGDREVPIETFLYEMRTQVRQAKQSAALPVVRIRIADGAGGGAAGTLDRLLRQLHAAGVRQVHLGD